MISLQIFSLDLEKKDSTNLAITYLHETILEERVANKSVCGMFLDFVKVFDCVNLKILRDKLEHYGVKHYGVKGIGVPQGSVLGPFLFLYINDLPNCCDSEMVLYADNSVL